MLSLSPLIAGPASAVAGQSYTLSLNAGIPSGSSSTVQSWMIDWGDGTGPELVSGNPSTISHVFSSAYLEPVSRITAIARDEGGVAYAATISALDGSYGTNGLLITDVAGNRDLAKSVLTRPDGRVVVGGQSSRWSNSWSWDFSVVSYNYDGTLDQTFGSGGKAFVNFGSGNTDTLKSVQLTEDGSLYAIGTTEVNGQAPDIAIAKLTPSGVLDSSFGTAGKLVINLAGWDGVQSAIADAQGRLIIVGGADANFLVARINGDGTIDSSFGVSGKASVDFVGTNEWATTVKLQADGKIVVAGSGNDHKVHVVRLNVDGSLDNSFGALGRVSVNFQPWRDSFATGMVIQSDGKIVVSGTCYQPSVNAYYFATTRFTSTGATDTTFGTGGTVMTTVPVSDQDAGVLISQDDEKLVLVGRVWNGQGSWMSGSDFGVMRYTKDGAPDPTFDGDGYIETSFGYTEQAITTVQTDGKLIVVGYLDKSNGLGEDFALARYHGVTNQGLPVALDAVPLTPANIQAVPYAANAVKLTWNRGSTNVSGYRLERGTSPNSGFTTIATPGRYDVGYLDQGLVEGKRYYYRLTAFNSFGDSPTSSVITGATKVAAPISLSATWFSTARIDLTWTDQSNSEAWFTVEHSLSSDWSNVDQQYHVPANSGYLYGIGPYNPAVPHYFRITAEGVADSDRKTVELLPPVGAQGHSLGWNVSAAIGEGSQVPTVDPGVDPDPPTSGPGGDPGVDPDPPDDPGGNDDPPTDPNPPTDDPENDPNNEIDLVIDGWPENQEEDPGAFIPLNQDFDEDNHGPEGTHRYDNELDEVEGDRIDPSDDELRPGYVTFNIEDEEFQWSIGYSNRVKLWWDDPNDESGEYVLLESGRLYDNVGSNVSSTIDFFVEGIYNSKQFRDVLVKASAGGVTDKVKLTVLSADLDVDSDNTSTDTTPVAGLSRNEDYLEQQPEELGRLIQVSKSDWDWDGVPNFADGFNLDGISTGSGPSNTRDDSAGVGSDFAALNLRIPKLIDPSVATIVFNYSASNPAAVQSAYDAQAEVTAYTPAAGYLRVWRWNEDKGRKKGAVNAPSSPGDFIPNAGQPFTLNKLGFNQNERSIQLYVEAVRVATTEAQRTITIYIDPDGPGPAETITDYVKVQGIDPQIDIDSLNQLGFGALPNPQSPAADQNEDAVTNKQVGKYLFTNDDDTDSDGIPDWVDGYDLFDGSEDTNDDIVVGEQFVPVNITIPAPIDLSTASVRIIYDASNPLDIWRDANENGGWNYYSFNSGTLRLWTKDGSTSRTGFSFMENADSSLGAFVPSTSSSSPLTEESLEKLGITESNRTVTLYLEAVKTRQASDALAGRLKLMIDPDGQDGPLGYFAADAVRTAPVQIDLDIDSKNVNGIYGDPSGTPSEDLIEDDPEKPGKYIPANDGDIDGDGMVDFNDMLFMPAFPPNTPTPGLQFTPLVLTLPAGFDLQKTKLRFTYKYADPLASTPVYGDPSGFVAWTPPPGKTLRIWSVNGDYFIRSAWHTVPGDESQPQWWPASVAGTAVQSAAGTKITMYVEGILPSGARGEELIKVEADPDGEGMSQYVAEDSVRTTVVSVDADVDSNNNNGLSNPDRGIVEDQLENHSGSDIFPGKVILVDDFDSDGDLIPDYADGYNRYVGLAGDDISTGLKFVPVVISLPSILGSDQQVRITYTASDPMGISLSLDDPYVQPGGVLRLWMKNGGAARSGLGVLNGGDYLAPGIYTPQQLGISPGSSRTFYVEAVAPVGTVSDVKIDIAVKPVDASDFVGTDQIRFTASRIEINARGFEDGETIVTNGFVKSNLSFDPVAYPSAITPGSFQSYIIKVYDPRTTGLSQFFINGQPLALTYKGGYYETPEFVISDGTAPGWNLPFQVVVINGSTADFSYNPFGALVTGPSVNGIPAHRQALADAIDKAVKEMEAQGWNGGAPGDSGAFGKEVHARVSAKLTAESPRWMSNVFVDNNTKVIVSIGQPPPGGVAGTTEIDLIYLKNGEPRFNVGDLWNHNRVEDLVDIKTSVGGKIGQQQLGRLKSLMNNREVVVTKGTPRRWTPAQGWHVNTKFQTFFRLLALFGAATSAWNIINVDTYDDERDAIIAKLEFIRNRDYDHIAGGDSEKITHVQEVTVMLSAYMSHFAPDDTIVKIITVKRIYELIAEMN